MSEAREPFEVFLSHYSEEQVVAEVLQDYLHMVFGGDLRVFLAPDDGRSIPTGEDQFAATLQALTDAKVYIVLVSKHGAHRPWLNFEVGFGKALKVRLFTVLVCESVQRDVPMPLAQFELRPLALPGVVEEIVGAIADQTGRPKIAVNTNWFLAQLHKREASLPKRELCVVPFRFPMSVGESLGFNVCYQGPRPIKLVKIWAEVPSKPLDKNWTSTGVTGFLSSQRLERDGRTHLRLEYIANTGSPNLRETGGRWEPLPPHLAPSADPFFLRELRFALDATAVGANPDELVRCQVVTEDGESQVFEYRLSEIEMRSRFRF